MKRMRMMTVFIGETDDGRVWATCDEFVNDRTEHLLKPALWTDSGQLFLELSTAVDSWLFTCLATTELGQRQELRSMPL